MNAQVMCSGGEADLVPGRLRGYRCWNFRDDAQPPTLVALNYQYGAWSTARMSAVCKRQSGFLLERDHRHPAPASDCMCGLWGWYRPDETRITRGTVFGAIDAYGRTSLGDYGFRAQHARIVALAYDGAEEVRAGLRRNYGVPVYSDEAELVAYWPADDIRTLVPTALSSDPYRGHQGTLLCSSALDPYRHPEEFRGEPIWAYQLLTVHSGWMFGDNSSVSGMTVTLKSRFSGREVVTDDPAIVSLFLSYQAQLPRPAPPLRPQGVRRSALIASMMQLQSASPSTPQQEEPQSAAKNLDVKKLALIRRAARPTGPKSDPFTRQGRGA